MKKSITTLLVAILVFGTVSAFALEVNDSASAIKKVTLEAIKAGNMAEIIDLLGKLQGDEVSAKQKTVVLNAVKAALNTSTVKSSVPAAVAALNSSSYVSVTKAAGGKWNIQVIETDSTTGSVIKEDIPKAAVEKPTLSTDPTVNKR